jgi:serine/threonine protein phosphatase PrpC
MLCPKCQTPIRADARYCPRCGMSLKTHELAPAGAPRAHLDQHTQKMPDKRIGPYRVVRPWRPDDNIYVVETTAKVSGASPQARLAIEVTKTLPTAWKEHINQMAMPNIVKVVNQVRDERGVPFLIVDLVEGEPLDRVKPTPERALKVGLQLATLVDYVHQNGFTFNVSAAQGNQDDSLRRFQKAFLLDHRDQLYFFNHSLLVTLPAQRDARAKLIQEDIWRIVRTFMGLLTGSKLGRLLGPLRRAVPQLASTTEQLVKQPPTNARDLAAAFTQMLPPAPSPAATIKLTAPKPMVTQPLPAMLTLVPFAQTDVGKQREHNEDNYLLLPMDASSGLFVVADGMGGQAAGEVASQLAVEAMRERALQEWSQLAHASAEAIRGHLHAWVQYAHTQIVNKAREQHNNMGSTLTAALIWNRQAFVANVGDSRTYLWREGELYPLTWDHSLVASLVRAGLLNEEAVYDHPQRNEIFRSLGQPGELKIDVFEPLELARGDQILLCSDGLWEMARPPRIKEILTQQSDVRACCAELIRTANEQGGEDNITVVLIRIE